MATPSNPASTESTTPVKADGDSYPQLPTFKGMSNEEAMNNLRDHLAVRERQLIVSYADAVAPQAPGDKDASKARYEESKRQVEELQKT